jgi:hypothetical protein
MFGMDRDSRTCGVVAGERALPHILYFASKFDDFTPPIISIYILHRRKVNESRIIKIFELYCFIDLSMASFI